MTSQGALTYLKLCTEYYDLEPHRDHEAAFKFYMNCAYRATGCILEPMCGTGRFLIPMLQAGCAIEGFDASSYMLDAFKKKYANISEKQAPVWQQFIQEFNNGRLYDLIFIPYGSWGLITNHEGVKKSLENIYSHLAEGGKFIIDIETVASTPEGLNTWHRGIHVRPNGSLIALNTFPTYDCNTQLFSCICRYESIIANQIETEVEDFKMHLYQFDEMDRLLEDAGFKHIKKYQDYNYAQATNIYTPLIIYECSK